MASSRNNTVSQVADVGALNALAVQRLLWRPGYYDHGVSQWEEVTERERLRNAKGHGAD